MVRTVTKRHKTLLFTGFNTFQIYTTSLALPNFGTLLIDPIPLLDLALLGYALHSPHFAGANGSDPWLCAPTTDLARKATIDNCPSSRWESSCGDPGVVLPGHRGPRSWATIWGTSLNLMVKNVLLSCHSIILPLNPAIEVVLDPE